jgi:deoxyguanosine kinase
MLTIVSVEGNIGSGKSTLLGRLAEYYTGPAKIVFLKEPVDEWAKIKDLDGTTILEKFYENPEKYGFSFQIMAYMSRLKIMRDTINKYAGTDTIILTERCLYTDKLVFTKMLYDTGKINYINYQIYMKYFEAFMHVAPINKIVYLKTSPDVCHSRIAQRARPGEAVISQEYLNTCHEYQENMLLCGDICDDQLFIDGNGELSDAILADICEFIAGV